MTEVVIIDRVNAGGRRGSISCEEQLEQFISQYQNLIYSICYRLTGDYFDAEDLAQDTFLSAYKNLPHFDGANEKAWLCRIATNKCIDYLKKAGRRSVPTDESYFHTVAAADYSPEETLMQRSVRQELLDCIESLKEPYRSVAVDYFYREIEISEIAAKTGKNIKTIQTQVYRAKAMIRKLYKKEVLQDG